MTPEEAQAYAARTVIALLTAHHHGLHRDEPGILLELDRSLAIVTVSVAVGALYNEITNACGGDHDAISQHLETVALGVARLPDGP